jgi:hypothetical protein
MSKCFEAMPLLLPHAQYGEDEDEGAENDEGTDGYPGYCAL